MGSFVRAVTFFFISVTTRWLLLFGQSASSSLLAYLLEERERVAG